MSVSGFRAHMKVTLLYAATKTKMERIKDVYLTGFWCCTSLDLVHRIDRLQKPEHVVNVHLVQVPLDMVKKKRILLEAQ